MIYSLLIGITVYNSISNALIGEHEQTITRLEAQLISELNFLLKENESVANTGVLRSDAALLVANDADVKGAVDRLFADIIRLNPNEIPAGSIHYK
jgi:hypothetical protein